MKDSTKKAAPFKRLLTVSLGGKMPVKSQDRWAETESRFEPCHAARFFRAQEPGRVFRLSVAHTFPKFV